MKFFSFDVSTSRSLMAAKNTNSLPMARDPETSLLNTKLPADVLYKIFTEYSRFCRDKLQIQPLNLVAPRFVYKDDGLRLLHVCRFWRSAALSCSVLWDLIFTPSYPISQIQQYLACSNSRPLTVYFTTVHRPWVPVAMQKTYNARVMELLRGELWRIKDLRLSDLGEREVKDGLQSLLQGARGLESLTLSLYYTTFLPSCNRGPLQAENIQIPYKLEFLKEMNLFGILPDLEFFTASSISRLHISNMEIDRRLFISCLTNCAEKLTSLGVSNVSLRTGPSIGGGIAAILAEALRTVDIPNLEELQLNLNDSQNSSLIKLLTFPSATSVYIISNFSRSFSSMHLTRMVSSYYSILRMKGDSLKIAIYPDAHVVVEVGKLKAEVIMENSHSWDILVGLYEYLKDNNPDLALSSHHQLFAIHDLKSLEVSFNYPVEIQNLHIFFDEFRRSQLYRPGPDHVLLLKNVISAASALQRLKFNLINAPEEDKKFDPIQTEIIGLMKSLQLGRDPHVLPELNAITLGGFNLKAHENLSGKLLEALSKWNNIETTLKLENPRHLTAETTSEIARMVHILIVDGAEDVEELIG